MRARQVIYVAIVLAACTGQATGTSITSPPAPSSTSLPGPTTSIAIPATSENIAVAFVEAWQAGDRSAMEALAEPDALVQADELANLAGEEWQFHHCEGAAGTIFCVWASGTDQLAIGVGNIDEPHLVTSVSLVDV